MHQIGMCERDGSVVLLGVKSWDRPTRVFTEQSIRSLQSSMSKTVCIWVFGSHGNPERRLLSVHQAHAEVQVA